MLNDLITVVSGDITQLDVDVIVNAAKPSLTGGCGVDGVIHYAAGPGLLEECRKVAPCPMGDVRLTSGFNLKAPFIIHAVGPPYQKGTTDHLLKSCYRGALLMAHMVGAQSIAFPCISTGSLGFPKEVACDIAVEAVTEWLESNRMPMVVFCCYEGIDAILYRKRLGIHSELQNA